MDLARAGAKKRSQAVPIPDRNASKYFSYSEAWVRIKKARASGFYLEAVTLQEHYRRQACFVPGLRW